VNVEVLSARCVAHGEGDIAISTLPQPVQSMIICFAIILIHRGLAF
jgi:hypothetical protein